MSGADPDWRAAWAGALDELELDVVRAEELLHDPAAAIEGPAAAWEPAPGLGPLPEDLRARAGLLLDRQLAVAEALVKAMLGNRQHAELVERFVAHDEAGPAYLDRTA